MLQRRADRDDRERGQRREQRDAPGPADTATGRPWRGRMSSLKNSLIASASGCSRPSRPDRFGPMRACSRLMTRRSNQVM